MSETPVEAVQRALDAVANVPAAEKTRSHAVIQAALHAVVRALEEQQKEIDGLQKMVESGIEALKKRLRGGSAL